MAKKSTKRTTKKKPTTRTKEVKKPSIPETENSTLHDALAISGVGIAVRRITTIDELLTDRDSLQDVAERTAAGGSIDTVGMALGLPPGVLKQWLKIGENEREGPFRAFYEFYLKASAAARISAEANLLAKNPGAWLDRCDVLKDLQEDEIPQTPTFDTQPLPNPSSSEAKESPKEETKQTNEEADNYNSIPEGYGSITFDDGELT